MIEAVPDPEPCPCLAERDHENFWTPCLCGCHVVPMSPALLHITMKRMAGERHLDACP